jgi:hypothetical protein
MYFLGWQRQGTAWGKGSWPVSRVLSNTLRYSGSHSSGPAVACRLEQPTRGQHEPCYGPPIWSCSGWGLPCHFCCQKRGGLLPGGLKRPPASLRRAPFHHRLIRHPLATRAFTAFAAANVGHRQTILCGTFHRLTASGR